MSRFFNPDSPVMSFLSDALDFIVLNLIAVVCALPVVTAGASFSALAGVMTAYTLEQSPIRVKDFFVRFRAVFLRATVSWLILLALAALFFMNLRIAENMPSTLRLITVSGLLFFALCLSLSSVMLFPMLSFTEEKRLPTLWKNAFLLGIAKLPRTLPMAVIQAIPVLMAIFAPQIFLLLSPVWLVIWFSLAAFLCAKIGGRWYTAELTPR
ncbi:MAG: DUF624 domain-containing protein [Clostridiaceae bacterium]